MKQEEEIKREKEISAIINKCFTDLILKLQEGKSDDEKKEINADLSTAKKITSKIMYDYTSGVALKECVKSWSIGDFNKLKKEYLNKLNN